jgi:hypothetical protein
VTLALISRRGPCYKMNSCQKQAASFQSRLYVSMSLMLIFYT